MTFRSAASLVLFPLLLIACDDAAGPSSGDRLTRAEAMLIAGEVTGSVNSTSAMPAGNAQDGIAGVPITFSRTHESTLPCPRGGTIALAWRVDGSVDAEAGSFELDIDGTHKITDFAARKRTVEGNICGHTVKETSTWGS